MANEAFGASQFSVNGIDWEEQEKALTAPIDEVPLAGASSMQPTTQGQTYVLTAGADAIFGTGGDDVIRANSSADLSSQDELHGGEGVDTLLVSRADLTSLKGFDGIEIIRGDEQDGTFTISAERLRDVLTIDGGEGYDDLRLTGGAVSLTGKTLLGIDSISYIGPNMFLTVDTKDVALKVTGSYDSGSTLILAGNEVFTAAEREGLFNSGISTIIDSSGTYRNVVPELVGPVGGYVKAGEKISFLSKATLVDDDTNTISVQVWGWREGVDHLSIDTTGRVKLVQDGSTFVTVDGTIIGRLQDNGSAGLGLDLVGIVPGTSAELLTEYLRAITYSTSNLEDPAGFQREFRVLLLDELRRESVKWGNIFIGEEQNSAPTDIILSDLTVLEHDVRGSTVGVLTTTDANVGDTFIYTLVNDAGGRFTLDGDKILVGDGLRIDYERQQEHEIVVSVDDGHGGVFEKTISISVRDMAPELVRGSEGDDLIVANVGNDQLYGNGGNDTLVGGEGRDRLYGGAGNDAFVFEQTPSVANRDTIYDFNTAEDSIYLAKLLYQRAGPLGVLKEEAFVIGTAPTTEEHRIIYDIEDGRLYYDADGIGEDFVMREITFFFGDEKPILTFSSIHIYDSVSSPFI